MADIFISYSHKDKIWLDKIQTWLKPLKRNYGISKWDDTMIQTGKKGKEEIEKALLAARVAILLVTPDFIASDFINDEELPTIFERAEKEGVVIFWIAVRHSSVKHEKIYDFQCANNPDEPLESLSESDKNRVLSAIYDELVMILTNPDSGETQTGAPIHLISSTHKADLEDTNLPDIRITIKDSASEQDNNEYSAQLSENLDDVFSILYAVHSTIAEREAQLEHYFNKVSEAYISATRKYMSKDVIEIVGELEDILEENSRELEAQHSKLTKAWNKLHNEFVEYKQSPSTQINQLSDFKGGLQELDRESKDSRESAIEASALLARLREMPESTQYKVEREIRHSDDSIHELEKLDYEIETMLEVTQTLLDGKKNTAHNVTELEIVKGEDKNIPDKLTDYRTDRETTKSSKAPDRKQWIVSDQLQPCNLSQILPDFAWCYVTAGTVNIQDGTLVNGVYTPSGKTNEDQVEQFYISKYPITHGQFLVFIADEDGYSQDDWWELIDRPKGKEWRQRNKTPPVINGDNLMLPLTDVNAYEALAFCRWLFTKARQNETKNDTNDITLPTEQQWQRAAQGDDQRLYPWGNDVDPDYSNIIISYIRSLTPVNYYESSNVSPFGVVDMSGNAWEWCLPTSSKYVLKGGTYRSHPETASVVSHMLKNPQQRDAKVGFRIVTTLKNQA